MRIGFIYELTCATTGQRYIGQTRRKTIEQRWKEHIKYTKKQNNNSKLSNAIRKYGPSSFLYRTLEECSTLDMLNEQEVYWIKLLDTMNNGLNLNEGGKAPHWSQESKQRFSMNHPLRGKFGCDHPAFGYRHTEEVKECIRKASLGRKRTPESIAKGAAKIKGHNNPWYGKHLPESTRQKMSEQRRGVKRSPEVMAKCLAAGHAANRGRVQSEDERQRRSIALKGKPKSDEHKRKLSEAAKRRWQRQSIEK
jgi:group I intron endonuclease